MTFFTCRVCAVRCLSIQHYAQSYLFHSFIHGLHVWVCVSPFVLLLHVFSSHTCSIRGYACTRSQTGTFVLNIAFSKMKFITHTMRFQILSLLFRLLLQFFEYSTTGEIRYNTRTPAGCIVGDNISTYLTVQHCAQRGQSVPTDQKFVFRKVTSVFVKPTPASSRHFTLF